MVISKQLMRLTAFHRILQRVVMSWSMRKWECSLCGILVGFLWIFMDFYGLLWIMMDFYGFLWIFMDCYGFLWIFMDFYGFYGFLWIFMFGSGFEPLLNLN